MDKYKRKAIFDELNRYDLIAGKNDYIEVTEWHNGEGFDVEISSKLGARFQLTYGEYNALKKLVKKINK